MPKIENIHNLDFKNRTSGIMKVKCPFCHDSRKNKSDKSLYINLDLRVFHCYNCEKKGQLDGWKADREYKEPAVKWHDMTSLGVEYMASRGISERVIIRNKLHMASRWFGEEKPAVECIAFPYYDETHTKPKNVKYRGISEKMFGQEKDAIPLMYNIHEWTKSKEVIILEGEIDVCSLNECEIWNATSVNAGAINPNDENIDGKLQCLYNSHKHFENKEKIILFCDRDAAGQRLEFELATKLGTYRCHTVKTPDGYKDANEVLNGSVEKNLPALGKLALQEIIAKAKPIPVSGVHYAGELMEVMLYNFENGKRKGSTTHFKCVDELFVWKKGDINTWTGWANFGKTQLFLQMALTKSVYDGWKWAVFSPENFPPEDFYDDLIESLVGKHVDSRMQNKMSKEEYEKAIAFVNEHFIFVYPDDLHTLDEIHDKFKSLFVKHGIDGVLIDPFNQLDNLQGGLRDDQYVSLTLKTAKRFALEYNISYNIIVHPKLMQKNADGSRPVPDAYDIAQGAMWPNKSDNIMTVHRPNWHLDKNSGLTTFYTQKIKRKRTGGSLGDCELFFDINCMRYKDSFLQSMPLDVANTIKTTNIKALWDDTGVDDLPF